ILIGVVHICLGWAIQAMNYALSRRKYFALADSFVKIALLSLGTVLIFVYGFNLTGWFSGAFPPILLVIIPSAALLFMRVLGKVFRLDYLKEVSVTSILSESSMQTMETFLSILSNVASYSRLLALMGAHLGLMLVVQVGANLIAAQVASAGILGQILVTFCLVLGNFMVIVLETLLAFIQNMRLHFYEFFSKFYKGSGVPFKPVALNHKYSEISFKSTENPTEIIPQIEAQPVG
ncbi:MAG TPA: V-type ATPase 116kDa subunit family protein, partial [Candidatus Lokiarchaeia archaeon]|nr:V-type ATPase 116kDa subunit family protein [Candidatus Lokiarchaeia archaeon]